MLQNWNNIISYIKYNLGMPFNLLELSDNDIIDYLKNQVLPEFSQHIPNKLFIKITPADQTVNDGRNITYHQYEYKLNIPDDVYVIGVENVFWNQAAPFTENSWNTIFIDPTDVVLANAYTTLRESMQVVPEFNFFPPRTITLSLMMGNGLVAEVNTIHTALDTIQPDLYNSTFKKMCLSAILKYLYSIRSKFNNLSTPFGQIQLNTQDLQTRFQQIDQEVADSFNWIPPNQLLAWF
jgi:hypothetical protein